MPTVRVPIRDNTPPRKGVRERGAVGLVGIASHGRLLPLPPYRSRLLMSITIPFPDAITRVPQQVRASLSLNQSWPGVTIRGANPDGTFPDLDLAATLRTGQSSASPSFVLTDLTVSTKDADGFYRVSLPSSATSILPSRTLYADVVSLTDDSAITLMQITFDVVDSTYTPAPAP